MMYVRHAGLFPAFPLPQQDDDDDDEWASVLLREVFVGGKYGSTSLEMPFEVKDLLFFLQSWVQKFCSSLVTVESWLFFFCQEQHSQSHTDLRNPLQDGHFENTYYSDFIANLGRIKYAGEFSCTLR